MNFEYLETIRRESSIDIETPGNCALQGFKDSGEEYYLIIDTKLGFTKIKTFGPFEDGEQSTCFSYMTYQIEYNEQKVHKTITAFLKDKTQVFECSTEQVCEKLGSVVL